MMAQTSSGDALIAIEAEMRLELGPVVLMSTVDVRHRSAPARGGALRSAPPCTPAANRPTDSSMLSRRRVALEWPLAEPTSDSRGAAGLLCARARARWDP